MGCCSDDVPAYNVGYNTESPDYNVTSWHNKHAAEVEAALTLRLNALETKHHQLRLEVCYIWTGLLLASIALFIAAFLGH